MGGLAAGDELELRPDKPVEFQLPGFAIDEEKLTHAHPRVKLELFTRPIVIAGNLHEEIGPAEVERVAIDRPGAGQHNRHVRAAVVSFPTLFPVAHIDARENSDLGLGCKGIFERRGQTNHELLMFEVR
jgi:hypothetical protein